MEQRIIKKSTLMVIIHEYTGECKNGNVRGGWIAVQPSPRGPAAAEKPGIWIPGFLALDSTIFA